VAQTPPPPSEPGLGAPSFDVVRVDAAGNALIAGRAKPLSEVTVLIDGAEAHRAMTDDSGAFAAFLSVPEVEVPRVLSLVMEETDTEPVASKETVILAPPVPEPEPAPEPAPVVVAEPVIAEPAPEDAPLPEAALALAQSDKIAPAPEPSTETAAAVPEPDPAPDLTETDMAALPKPAANSAAPATETGAGEVQTDLPPEPAPVDTAEPAPEPAPVDNAEIAPEADPTPTPAPAPVDIAEPAREPEPLPEDTDRVAEAAALDPTSPLTSEPVVPALSDAPQPAGDAAAEAVPSPAQSAAPSVQPVAPPSLDVAGVTSEGTDTSAAPVESALALPTATTDAPLVPGAAPSLSQPSPDAPSTVAEPAPSFDRPQAPAVLMADETGLRVLQSGGDLPIAAQEIVIDTISYTPDGEVALGGRGTGADFVRVYLDNRPIKTTRIGRDGQWQTPLPEVDTGVYTLRVDQLNAEGEVTSRMETPFKREEPTLVAELDTRDDTSATGVVTVQPGNTLWGIATDEYGEGLMYVRVFRANRDRIRNPDLIYPGQVFTIPEG
jgi:nucleoid-associated protein YgaU